MDRFFSHEQKSAVDALYDAQRLAFAPIVFQATRALRELGILDALDKAEKPGTTIEAIAHDLQLSEYGVRILLESGLSAGVVSVSNSYFTLTKTGYYILSDPMTRINMDYNHSVCYQGLYFLEEAVRTGKPAGLRVFGDWETIYPGLTALPKEARESWFKFNQFYSGQAFPQALPLVLKNQARSVLDIGGNTGLWAIACAQFSDQVQVTIVDLPEQLAVARRAIAESSLVHRVSCLELNLLDSDSCLPKNFDIIWMSQLLDCFGPVGIERVLNLAAEAMNDDTRLYILEPLWDRQRHEMSAYCLINTSLYFTCLANGESRMYESLDMKRFIEGAGLSVVQEWDGLGICHTLLECKKSDLEDSPEPPDSGGIGSQPGPALE